MHTKTGEMRRGNDNLSKENCLSVRHQKNTNNVVYSMKEE